MTQMPLPRNASYQKACEVLETLPIHRPWSIERFVADISMMLGVPIRICDLPAAMSHHMTGLWVPRRIMNSIYVRIGAAGEYREHIICHEIAHIVMAHHRKSNDDLVELLKQNMGIIAPDISSELIDKLEIPQLCFARSDFLHPIEQEAEWLATLIMNKAAELRQRLYPETVSGTDREILQRIAKVIGWNA